ncbi:MAG: CoA pyrophosphatase [Deltaproteobacteria bacterium]|jgi:hypothetical protein|nr:CoA pyrophosphatase [Deltaproteobacteria bacterium]MBW2478513.1 CoA pyrophosphatase [Deltaproteobacteria bacterium]
MVARNDIHWRLLTDRSGFLDHVIQTLGERIGQENYLAKREIHWQTSAGVVMLLGDRPAGPDKRTEPCLVLNKRSLRVRQPGDLCFPGGSMAPLIDPCLASLFSLPFSSLGRWPYWKNWRQTHRRPSKSMSILWATGLRESLEEMRLNPFGVRFLGPLPPRSLVMFKRTIYPMVGWINRQKRFFPNWEVEKVVRLPLKDLLNPKYYSRYRLQIGKDAGQGPAASIQHYPCFRLQAPDNQEILWGATYRITLDFLRLVFGFEPPALAALPVVDGVLDETYLTGQK